MFINEDEYYVKHLSPEPIIVPIGVEAVWALITPKVSTARSHFNLIASVPFITEDRSQLTRITSMITLQKHTIT